MHQAPPPSHRHQIAAYAACLILAAPSTAGTFADNFDAGSGGLDASPSWSTRAFGTSNADFLYEAGGNGGQRIDLPAGTLAICTADPLSWAAGENLSLRVQVLSPTDGTSTDNAHVTLRGTAPVDMATPVINGRAVEPDWSGLQAWSLPFVLRSGTQILTMQELRTDGTQLAQSTLTLTFTGASNWPAVRISEWAADNGSSGMADPADGQFEDWLELHNPAATATDLTGWTLSDDPAQPARFTFPPGTIIPAGGFLLVWADGEPEQTDFARHRDVHASFALNARGESLVLHAPDGTRIDGVSFGPQPRGFTSGRTGPGALDHDLLSDVTPGAVNGPAAAIGRLELSPAGLLLPQAWPRFSYLLETSTDLANWVPVGEPIPLSEAGPLLFPPLAVQTGAPAKFIRAVRRP